MLSAKNLQEKFLKKRQAQSNKDLEAFKDIADDVIESDFVPYACLYDPETLATKDGELLQIIKITGLGYDAHHHGDLRTAIRTAIREAIPDASYAIWLHTLRRRQGVQGRAHFPDPFSGKIDEAWRALQPTSTSYVNELYVTIVRASGPTKLTDIRVLKQSLVPKVDLKGRNTLMDTMLRELQNTTGRMVEMLRPYGARRLTVVERNGLFYGEHLEFLEKLINLEERAMLVPERDLSHVLTSGEITFGFNAMEVRSAEGVRRFAAILTLKEYKESTLAGIDKFLEIPCELIVSQCFDFTGAEQAREAYEKNARYLAASGDKDLSRWVEIDRLMSERQNDPKSFGQQQTCIFLIAPSVNVLESNVRMVQRALNRLGMIVIREDVRFEDCYWAQLPGNFPFISRKHAVDTDHLAGFVNLQAAPMGNAAGSSWGAPVSLFTTVQDAPYYYNFHRNQSAHSFILGPAESGRTTFAHFLLSQARKLPLNIWYLDAAGRGGHFVKAMGGQYTKPGSSECKLNPLLLPDTPGNREFLALWLSTLIDPTGVQLNRSTLGYFQHVIDQVLKLPREQRRIPALVHYIREADNLLANTLQRYAAGGAFGELFDMPEDTFKPSKLCGWDISRWMADPATRVPLTSYLLHRLTGALDRTPTLLVMSDGFTTLDTPLYSMRAGSWFDYLSQNNAAAMMIAGDIEASANHAFTSVLANKVGTLFAMADKAPSAGYSMGFGLKPEEIATLGFIDGNDHQVLQKRGDEAVVIKANLGTLPPGTLNILSGRVFPQPNPADVLANLMTTKQAG